VQNLFNFFIPGFADFKLGFIGIFQDNDVRFFFVLLDFGDIINLNNVGTMDPDKVFRVKVRLEELHGFLLDMAAIVGVDHHIIVE
jgi:hypothetical protein